MIKKILSIILAIVLLAGITPVFAQARYGLTVSDAIEASTSLAAPAGSWLYGIKIFADAASSYMGVYDSATFAAGSTSNVVDEIGEATQYDTAETWYTKPKYCSNGVSVVIFTGVGFVWTGQEPAQ